MKTGRESLTVVLTGSWNCNSLPFLY